MMTEALALASSPHDTFRHTCRNRPSGGLRITLNTKQMWELACLRCGPPGVSDTPGRRYRRQASSHTCSPSFSGRGLLPAVDLVKHPAIVEVGFLHGAPVAKGLLDRQEVDFRETIGVLGQHFRITRAQVVAGRDFLAFRRPQVLQVVF